MASIISAGTTSGTSLNLSGDTSGVLQLATNGSTTAITVDTSQRVGIGTASPALPLDINTGGSGSVNINGTGSGPWMRWQLSGTAFAYIGSGAQLGAGSASDFCFNSQNNMTFTSGGNSERMRIDTSGNVGIGTSSSGNKFEVAGSGMFSGAVTTNTTGTHISYQSGNSQIGAWGPDTSTNGTLVFFSARSNGVNGLERMRIDSSGNLLIGKTSYSSTVNGFQFGPADNGANIGLLSITGNSTNAGATAYQLYSTSNSTFRFYVNYAGTIFAQSTTISGISDQRLKENIVDLDVGLDAVMALKPRKFDWKEGKGKDIKGDRGFVAQEFETVFPDLVDEWKDPSPEGEEPYKSVRADLIPVLVKAIQELKAELDATKAEVAALKGVN